MNLLDLVQKHQKTHNIHISKIFNNQTPPVVSNDMDVAFIKPVTVQNKENLGIKDNNLILSGEEFPANPTPGQLFKKNGKTYIYVKEEN
jgi:hypothetical protein